MPKRPPSPDQSAPLSFLKVPVPRAVRARWSEAAAKCGQRLEDWVINHLNQAVPESADSQPKTQKESP